MYHWTLYTSEWSEYFGPLLYIPCQYAFARSCLSLANISKLLSSCLYSSGDVEPRWLVYNVNVFVSQMLSSSKCFLVLRNKSEWVFSNIFLVTAYLHIWWPIALPGFLVALFTIIYFLNNIVLVGFLGMYVAWELNIPEHTTFKRYTITLHLIMFTKIKISVS